MRVVRAGADVCRKPATAKRAVHRAGAREGPRHPRAARRRSPGLTQNQIAARARPLGRASCSAWSRCSAAAAISAAAPADGTLQPHPASCSSSRIASRRSSGCSRVALPLMHELARTTRQSNHLVVHARAADPGLAQVDSPEAMGFSVRLGAHFDVSRRPGLGARAHRVPERRATRRDDPADAAQRPATRRRARAWLRGSALISEARLRGARQRHPAGHHRPLLPDPRSRRPCGRDADPALPAPARRHPLGGQGAARPPAGRRGDLPRARRDGERTVAHRSPASCRVTALFCDTRPARCRSSS